jgi:hypothetical protein
MKNLCARLALFVACLLLLPNLLLGVKFGRQFIEKGQLAVGYDIVFMSKIPNVLLALYLLGSTLLVGSFICEDKSTSRRLALFANLISVVVVIGWYYLRHVIFESIR